MSELTGRVALVDAEANAAIQHPVGDRAIEAAELGAVCH